MLTLSLLLTGVLGMLQEVTYKKYGPHWKEGLFYTHSLSLPVFLFLIPHVSYGFQSLSSSTTRFSHPNPQDTADPAFAALARLLPTAVAPFTPYLILGVNLVTQLICVSGVNQLSSVSRTHSLTLTLTLTLFLTHADHTPLSLFTFHLSPHMFILVPFTHQRVSSVSTNLVLTTRKAVSLCFSVWWFGNGWNTELGVGAGMVFLGSVLYTLVSSSSSAPQASPSPGKRKKVE
ncbi:hypothetical protein EUX98_g1797 [Antrodiella citrinella]|uniref:Sugar phosphate transporter domain-containing protein n=1 Tax=Antrodiella citrinella TaxID=2447956 RepID=A0A4S4N0K0_9APHY|nr:hypothetical protein EUX98_g1797 [Antrodiella citrinella]